MKEDTQKSYLYQQQNGPVTIPMTNDYQFRALMQLNHHVLRGLVGSLLHLTEEEIVSIDIKNPIELGKYISDKDFILDLKIILNNQMIVNLELQVANQHNWQERSLLYLCRIFDNVNAGEDYITVLPAVHIGLLDFELFAGEEEFYSSYMMQNVKTHKTYSEKLRLNVMELKKSGFATEEDKEWKLDCWAQFFKAKTWEEIQMLAERLPVLAEAAETIYHISLEDKIREQCEAREDFFRSQKTQERLREMQEIQLEQQKMQLEQQKNQLEQQESQLAEQKNQLEQQESQLAEQKNQLAEQENQLTQKDSQLAEQENQLTQKDSQLAEQENQLTQKDSQLAEQENQLAEQENQLMQKDSQLAEQKETIHQQIEQLSQQTEQLNQKTEQLNQQTKQLQQKEEELWQLRQLLKENGIVLPS